MKIITDKRKTLEAVREDGTLLEYASKKWLGDKKVVLEAVRQDGRALEFASKEIKAEVVKVLCRG